MLNRFSRTQLLFGTEGMKKLSAARVAVFGVGGVGGYVVEALARSGIGALDIVDGDKVNVTNINRQIIATDKTIGRFKAEVAAERVADINPECKVLAYNVFFGTENEDDFDFSQFNYIVDAVDDVKAKVAIILRAKRFKTSVISSMGAGNKLNPAAFEVADIYKTEVCPLARKMRIQLKKAGVKSLKTVFSREIPIKPDMEGSGYEGGEEHVKAGSSAFAPPAAGLLIASEVVKDLLSDK